MALRQFVSLLFVVSHNLDGLNNEKPAVVFDVAVAKSFKVAGNRMFLGVEESCKFGLRGVWES